MRYTHQRSLLAALFLFAVVLRLFYLFDLKDDALADRLLLDPGAYDRKAAAILEGKSPDPGRAFYQAPLYAYYLAGVYAVAGRDLDAVRVVQVLLGGASVVLIARIGFVFFGLPTGWLAGAAAALYAPFPFFEAQIMKTSLGVFLLLAGFLMLAAGKNWRGALAGGFLVGLAALAQENALLLLFAAALGAAWGTRPRGGSLRRALLVLAGGSCALAPVAIRNRAVSGEWVLITSQGGQNFYIGNNERAEGTYTSLPFVRPDPRHEEEDFRIEAERRLGRAAAPSEVSRFWYEEGLRWMRAHPGDAAALVVRKALLFWNALELPDNENFYYMRDRHLALRLFPLTFGAAAVFALAGMVVSLRRFRELLLLYAGVGAPFAALVVFYVFSRYRLPVVPFLLLFAAEGVRVSAEAVRGRRWGRAAALAGVLAAAILLVHAARPIDFDPRREGFLPLHVNRAMLFAEEGDAALAIEEYREALRIAPDRPAIRKRLAYLLLEEGRREEALREMESARAGLPHDAAIRNDLALLLLEEGKADDALLLLREAVRLDPNLESARRNLDRLLRERGEDAVGVRVLESADGLRAGEAR